MVFLVIIFFGLLASTISGVAGFGGAMFLMPILVYVIGVEDAVPVLAIGQIFGNASRVWFGRYELQWRPVLYFISTAIPLSIVGSRLFVVTDKGLVITIVGVMLILMVVARRVVPAVAQMKITTMFWGGALTGFLSGLVGSAGPVGPYFFLGLNLPITSYIASEAMTSLLIHLAKIGVYSHYDLFSMRSLNLGMLLGATMVCGSFIGKKIALMIKRHHFQLLVDAIFIVTGLQMIFSNVIGIIDE